MKYVLNMPREDKMIGLAADIVYMQKMYWCHCSARELKLSFMGPRQHYSYDTPGNCPLIVFLCGGGWQKVDRNAWIPNLVYYTEHGYAVASVDYSVLPYTEYPEQLMEVKAAIRFLRLHADEFHIDPNRISVMGESAGGYLAALAALTGDAAEYKDEHYPEQSDAVQAAVAFYPPVSLQLIDNSGLRIRVDHFPDLCDLISNNTPPFMLWHGLADELVPWEQSERLYDALQHAGVNSEYCLIEKANHADALFVQKQVKQRVCSFLDHHLA